LELANEQLGVREIEMAFRVRDQFDRDLVHAWESRERSIRELRELAIVAFRQRRANLADVLLDRVKIVEEPFASRAYVDAIVCGVAECFASVEQELICLFEALEE
jgi:hypothetical protein